MPGKGKRVVPRLRMGGNDDAKSVSVQQYCLDLARRVRGGGCMSIYDEKPWLNSYAPGQPAEIITEHVDGLSMFRAAVARNPDADAIRYFGTRISCRELDALSDALAAALVGPGFARGDRVALYLQNVPQFVIGLIATWKASGVAVSI